MPRRKRAGRRRELDALDLMGAFVGAQSSGCAGVPPHLRDVDAMFSVFMTVGAPDGSWAQEAFGVGSVRPCETMRREPDAWGETPPPLQCGSACMFGIGGDHE